MFPVVFLVWAWKLFERCDIWDGRIATFNVDAMLTLLSVMGAAVSSAASSVSLGFWFSTQYG